MANATTEPKVLACSFCGKVAKEVRKLIAGPSAYICDECVLLCIEVVNATSQADTKSTFASPGTVLKALSKSVVGQEDAKRVLAVAVFTHYQRIHYRGLFPLPKSNVLLVGPTGVGKTLLIKHIASILQVPHILVTATAYTESGYVGEDVESMLSLLFRRADGDLHKAQQGIIFIDEIDKIARASQRSTGIARDVSGVGVQQALLTMIEGAEISIAVSTLKKHSQAEFVQFDTRNLLFIFAGAFTELENIVLRRTSSASRLITPPGVNTGNSDYVAEKYNATMRRATPDDIIEFGFIPEFIGRIGEISFLSALSTADLANIMRLSDQSYLKAYKDYFRLTGVEIAYDDEFVESVANIAIGIGTGARAIRSVLDSVFRDLIFELPGRKAVQKCVLTKEVVLGRARPALLGDDDKPIGWVRDTAFVGYCRKDTDLYQEMKTIFLPLVRTGKINLWTDENINAGQKWKTQIEEALSRAKVAIFLVSADFLASEFAIREELEYIVRVHQDEGIEIRWVLLNPCLFTHSPLYHIQAAHDVSKPLSNLTKPERHAIWMDLANQVHAVLGEDTSGS